jgi:hypothetical protein
MMGCIPLSTIYEPFIRSLWIFVSNDLGRFQILFQALGSDSGSSMFATGLMTLLCTAGIAFYVRFLVALCKEYEPRRIGYWARWRLRSGENTTSELQEPKKPVTRAAGKQVECGLLSNRSKLDPRLINRERVVSDVDPRSIRGTIGRTLTPLSPGDWARFWLCKPAKHCGVGAGTTTGKKSSGSCGSSGLTGIGLNRHRAGRLKALFRKAG